MCADYTLLPASLRFGLPVDAVGDAQYHGGSANVLRREYGGQEVAIKALRPHGLTPEEMKNVSRHQFISTLGHTDKSGFPLQRFCKEVITWKSLQHPNVLPLLGVVMTGTDFAMVSEWMSNGNIKEFIAADPDANRFELVGPRKNSSGPHPIVIILTFTVGRCCEGFVPHACSGNDTWGSQRSTLSKVYVAFSPL